MVTTLSFMPCAPAYQPSPALPPRLHNQQVRVKGACVGGGIRTRGKGLLFYPHVIIKASVFSAGLSINMVSGVNSVLFPLKINIYPAVSKTSSAKIRVEKLKNKYN